MTCRQLKGIDHAQHFIEVPPSGHRINEHKLDLLVGSDNEHVTKSLIILGLSLQGIA